MLADWIELLFGDVTDKDKIAEVRQVGQLKLDQKI